MKYYTILLMSTLLMSTNIIAQTQPEITIGISKDANSAEFNEFNTYLKEEIVALTKSQFKVNFKDLDADWERARVIQNNQQLMADPDVTLLVTLGYISSNDISGFKNFSKPVIAANILDQDFQNLQLKQGNATGIDNFTFIESIIQLKTDIHEFSQMFEAKELAILIPKALNENFPQLTEYLKQNNTKFNISVVSVDDSSSSALAQMPKNTDAAMVLPLVGLSKTEILKLFNGLNKRHIPSLAVSGVAYLNMGATVTLSPEFTFQQLARQVALRIMKISEGTNPSDIPVSIENARRVPIINMESIRSTNKFPKWNILNESILINATNFPTGKELNLRLAIAEALENNLQGKMAKKILKSPKKM